MKNKTTLLIAFVLAIFTTTTSFGQLVTSSADDGSPGTLRVEVANAASGSTVTFDPAVSAIKKILYDSLILFLLYEETLLHLDIQYVTIRIYLLSNLTTFVR